MLSANSPLSSSTDAKYAFPPGIGLMPARSSNICPPSKTILDRDSEKPKYIEWLKMDQFLLSCLKGTLSPSASAQVLGLQSSRQVWFGLGKASRNFFSNNLRHDFLIFFVISFKTFKGGIPRLKNTWPASRTLQTTLLPLTIL